LYDTDAGSQNIVGGKELKQKEDYPTPEQTYEKFSDFK